LVTLICLAPLAYWVEGFAAGWTLPFVFSIVWLGVVVSILSFFLIHPDEQALTQQKG
jgi:hypothetical protein